ncbi:MAG: hypothetical protein M3N18_05760 [Actinomycetota bacterium]|nr:hypothetical protein [Actinomycetota bacterium]
MALTVVAAATLLATLPALATSPTDSTVFYPKGNGVTYSCTGGSPFVHHGHDASMGNCAVQGVGPPADLICDVPTTITFVHDMHQDVEDGRLCR